MGHSVSTVYADTIQSPGPNDDITFGTSGGTVTLAGNVIGAKALQDKGGNNLWNFDPSGEVTSLHPSLENNLVLLGTQVVDQQQRPSNVQWGRAGGLINNDYDVYCFKFYNIHPTNSEAVLSFACAESSQVDNYPSTNAAWGSFNITSGVALANNTDAGGSGSFAYLSAHDIGHSNGAWQKISRSNGHYKEESMSGEMWMFSPGDTTKVTHFQAITQTHNTNDTCFFQTWTFGYLDTANMTQHGIDAVDFKPSAGTWRAGEFRLYGLS